MLLGDISLETFLEKYWQKKPLLIRNALPDFRDPLSPEELAGLACEEEAESRLVSKEKGAWASKNGPFQESDFTSLPDDDWTLLVQSVDHWFPEVKKLAQEVNFIPNWRIDDVMVSYAEKNAGVGPHFDYYDVFIIQGQGSRVWKIGQSCNSKSELLTESGLKILKEFEQQNEWTLEAGDVLYIPPGIAHYGTSLDSSLSYSIGFRAPSASEVVISFSDEICANLSEDQRYNDPNLQAAKKPGEIDSQAIESVTKLIQDSLLDTKSIPQWFGKYMTEPKNENLLPVPEVVLSEQDLLLAFTEGEALAKNPASRFAFIENGSALCLFVDGEIFNFSSPSKSIAKLNTLLNSSEEGLLNLAPFFDDAQSLTLLSELYNQGSLIFLEDF